MQFSYTFMQQQRSSISTLTHTANGVRMRQKFRAHNLVFEYKSEMWYVGGGGGCGTFVRFVAFGNVCCQTATKQQPAGRSATGIIHAHVLVRVRAGVLSYVCVCLRGSVCLCVYVLVWYT